MTIMTNMQPLHVPLQNSLDNQVTDTAPDRAGTATQSLSIESRRTTDIALVTSEGDRVTLSATSLFEATYEAYNSKGVMNTGVTGETLTLTASSALAISVEGSLNEQELEDIERVVSTMREMASEFFAGEVEEELLELFEEDHGLGTIASFRADISNTQQRFPPPGLPTGLTLIQCPSRWVKQYRRRRPRRQPPHPARNRRPLPSRAVIISPTTSSAPLAK